MLDLGREGCYISMHRLGIRTIKQGGGLGMSLEGILLDGFQPYNKGLRHTIPLHHNPVSMPSLKLPLIIRFEGSLKGTNVC